MTPSFYSPIEVDLPLLTFAKGPSTSIKLCANSGPLKVCCNCIMLPIEGSLPSTPPDQYSHCVPAAEAYQ